MKLARRSWSSHGQGVARAFGTCLILLVIGVPAAALGSVTSTSSYDSYSPKYVSAEDILALGDALGLCTVTKLPGIETLLMTGKASELAQFHAVLSLLDSGFFYDVRLIDVTRCNWTPAASERIAAAVDSVSIGSLRYPPIGVSGKRVIIDYLGSKVLVVAPQIKIDRVVLAVEKGILPSKQADLAPGRPLMLAGVGGLGRITDGPQTTPQAAEDRRWLLGQIAESPIRGTGSERPFHAQTYETPELANGEQVLDMNLPEKLSVVMLMELVGEHLKLDFMYDPVKVQGEVTLKLQGDLDGPIKVKHLYPLLESVLKFKNFVMNRRGNIVTVVPTADWSDIDPELRTGGGLLEHGDAIITRAFRLKHIDVASAEALLNSMKLGVHKSTIAQTKTLIITAHAYRLPRIEQLLDAVDRPGEPKLFRAHRLRYTMAKNLTEKVRALAEHLGTVTVSVTGAAATPSVVKRPGESEAAYQARLRAAARNRTLTRTAASKPAVDDSVYLDADERTNSVLMIGHRDDLVIVQDLIDSLDVEQQDPRQLKLYKIEYVDAENARQKLEELGIVGAPTYRDTRRRTPDPRASAAQPSTPRQTTPAVNRRLTTPETATDATLEEPQVVVVEATNALLVNATEEQHVQISKILSYVDSDTDASLIPYIIYPLENQDPEDLAAILENLIQETIRDAEGKIEQVLRKTDDDIVIVPDSKTFSIIAYANKRNQEWIKNLIETLDQRRPQVLIDVTLVEISETDDFEYDLNILSSFPDLVSTSGVTGPPLMAGGSGVNLVETLLNSGQDRFIDFRSGGGRGTGFYGDRHINALLTAMQTKSYGRVLAKPKILVNDNEEGMILTKETIYVETTNSVVPQQGDGAIVQTSSTFDPYDAGITLTIIPHISEGNLLRLELTLDRTDFGSREVAEGAPRDTSTSEVSTVVTVPDGSTIILGGMVKLNQNKGGDKVPFLGDLPFVGSLFRSVRNSDIQKQLYIFVKAQIIRPADVLAGESDLERISDRNRAAFERHEARFQNYQTWPGVEASGMIPARVLDAQ